MFNEYDYIVCKKTVQRTATLWLTEGKTYYIIHKYLSLGATWFSIEDDKGAFVDLDLQNMKDFFYDKKEARKLKLNKLKNEKKI